MFNAYIKKLIPIPLENIEVSNIDNYWYKITTTAHLADENKKLINKIIKNCNKIETFEGWFIDITNPYFKFAQIKFKKKEVLLPL